MQHVGGAVVEALDLVLTRQAANVINAGGKLIGRSHSGEWGSNAEAGFVEAVAALRTALELNDLGDEERRAVKAERFAEWAGQQTAVGPYALGAVPYPGVAKLIEECGELVHDLANPELSQDALHHEAADVLAACDFFIRWYDNRHATHILEMWHPAAPGKRYDGVVARCKRCGRDWSVKDATQAEACSVIEAAHQERCKRPDA